MNNHHKLREGLRTQEILDSIEEEDWNFKTSRQKRILSQKDTNYIPIRSLITRQLSTEEQVQNKLWPSSEYDEGTYKTSFWHKYPPIQIFLNWFEHKFGGDIHRVNLVRMCPGGSVKEHTDGGRYYKDKDRFHLVIQGEYEYTVNKESMIYKQGDLWWFNNKEIHESFNVTNQDRIVLIFDVKGCTDYKFI